MSARTRAWLLALSCLLGCDNRDARDSTVLRFAVYSDALITHVHVTVLDEHGQPTVHARDYAVPSDRSLSDFLFRMYVEQSASGRDGTALRFDGYLDRDGASQLILQRTVHARFTDGEMRLVRVWLASSCASPDGSKAVCPTQGYSCAYGSGDCQPDSVPVPSEPFVAELDDQARWMPNDYRQCGSVGDVYCPNNCTLEQDPDCRFDNGSHGCGSDVQCKSGICARACTQPGCTDKRCCESRCDDPCSWCNDKGQCQRLDFQADSSNCGGCGVVCSDNHNTPACQAGACLRMCAPEFEDCKDGLVADGCETNITSDPLHCGSCAGANAVCRYKRCSASQCQGEVVPKFSGVASFAYLDDTIFLRQVVPDRTVPVAALGVHVHATTPGLATLLLLSDLNGEPNTILKSGEAPLIGDEPGPGGITYGAEYIFDAPTEPLSVFWIGVALSDIALLQHAASPDFDPVRELSKSELPSLTVGTVLPTPVPAYENKPSITTDQGETRVAPWIYAVHFP